MSPDIARRLVASLKYDVINGSQDERAIFASQVREAIAYIDAQAAQIEALKDLLIDDRCKCIMLVEKLKLVANDPKWMEKGMEKTLDEYMQEARQQLKAEMPGVEWG